MKKEKNELKIPRYCISLSVTDNDTHKFIEEDCNVDTFGMVIIIIQEYIKKIEKDL